MIKVKNFFSILKKNQIDFFCGVPDSVLKPLTSHLLKLKKNHLIAHNEGGAVALASGYNLKTKRIPCVYLQNSGLGNIVNPIFSLTHKSVYSIPILFLIGWRGSPLSKDEIQHIEQGKKTISLLKLLNIDYFILKSNSNLQMLNRFLKKKLKKKVSSAILVDRNVFVKKDNRKKKTKTTEGVLRHEVINYIIENTDNKIKIFSTTGYTSRELYQLRKEKQKLAKDFYNVGAMGHVSMLSLGYSLSCKNKVICLDGDGSLIMHMGAIATISKYANRNLKHIVFNNQQHESVGGQPTSIKNIDIKLLSKSCGYKNYFFSKTFLDFKKKYKKFISNDGPSFFEVYTSPGSLKNLTRPKNLKNLKDYF